MLTIGNQTIIPPVVLAPMAGVTDQPFRLICKRYGCGLVCSEMVSDKALIHGNRRTRDMLAINPAERPVSIQLFGSEPGSMAQAAIIVADYQPEIIDINMGCPAPKIVKNGEGAALLRNPSHAARIIEAVVSAVRLPVTVKIRTGWDDTSIIAVQIARLAEKAGAAAITVHGRTREQFYTGEANWDIIAEVCSHVSIPVIGNGDVVGPESARAMFRKTGCQGVMIGQGALGNPWVFRRVASDLQNGEDPGEPPTRERFAVIREHLRAQVHDCGEERGVKEMRKHITWYLKGMPGAAQQREQVNRLSGLGDIERLLADYEKMVVAHPSRQDGAGRCTPGMEELG